MIFKKIKKEEDYNLAPLSPGVNKIKEFFMKNDDKQKTKLAILGIISFLLAAYISGMAVSIEKYGIIEGLGNAIWSYYFNAIFSLKGWLYMLILNAIILIVGWLAFRNNKDLDKTKTSDDRGVNYSSDGTYGTAEWMSEDEAKKVYEIGKIDDVTGTILAQYTTKGEKVICLPSNTNGNRNILILGSPGSGKSFCYVRNAIFQAIVRNESIVITDPKGELYESTSEMLRKKGYKVLVYNLVNPRRSDAWNCLSEIYDPETGDISDIRVTEFADTLMKNTTDGPDDHFWGTGESNLLKAIIMFCAWRREMSLKSLYELEGKLLFNQIKHLLSEEDSKNIMKVLDPESPRISMKEREKAIRLLIKLTKNDEAEYMGKIKREAPPCDMASMYYMLVTDDIKAFEEKFKAVPISHPAGISWCIFKNGSENVQPGIVQGLAQRLQLFQMHDIRRITTNDDINFETLGSEKTALFCIISDKSTSMRALTSLFFAFLFKDVSDAADRLGPDTRLPVNVICDEFANLGVIPSFDVTISTVRSRKINISIILQSIMQLEKNYLKAGSAISSCCDTVLFLGCNDMETAEYMSELSGIASIRVLSIKDDRNTSAGNRTVLQGYSLSEGDGKRPLMNPDEIRRLSDEDVILYHKGCNILKARRCGYPEHRFIKKETTPTVALRDYPLASEKYHLTEDLDSFLQGDASNMTQRNQAIVANQILDKGFKQATEANKKSSPSQLISDVGAFEF